MSIPRRGHYYETHLTRDGARRLPCRCLLACASTEGPQGDRRTVGCRARALQRGASDVEPDERCRLGDGAPFGNDGVCSKAHVRPPQSNALHDHLIVRDLRHLSHHR